MRFDFAAMADGDEHLAALGLGRLLIFPRMEILPRLHDLDIGPARFDQRIASGGNGRVLRAPELIAVGEIAVLAEQVGDRKSTRLNSSHQCATRMPSSA